MKETLMIVQMILSVLFIASYLMYDSNGNVKTDDKVMETGRNAFLSKFMRVDAVLFFIVAIAQLVMNK